MFDLIKKLTQISPRYGHREAEAAKVITNELKSLQINFVEEPFRTAVPKIIKAELFADGKSIPCLGSSLISGEINNGNYLISAFGHSGKNRPYNISYSPITDEISVVDIYQEPSVTISRTSIVQITMAKEVKGIIEVEKEKYTTENILVGNISNPENIIIAHFDSIVGDGALDNAAAIAVMIETIKQKAVVLQNTLFIFAGNEEISYDDYKIKSGYGFRMFESKHSNVLENAKQIIVIDGIGVSSPSFVQNGLDWVLQVKMLDKIRSKVFWLQNDQSEVLKYFHTKADIIENLSEKYLKEAQATLINKLSNRL